MKKLILLTVIAFSVFSCTKETSYERPKEIVSSNGDTLRLAATFQQGLDGSSIDSLKFAGTMYYLNQYGEFPVPAHLRGDAVLYVTQLMDSLLVGCRGYQAVPVIYGTAQWQNINIDSVGLFYLYSNLHL